MIYTTKEKISALVFKQRKFFSENRTLDIKFRLEMLKKLLVAVNKWEEKFYQALQADLHKSREESFLTEISIVKAELKYHIKNIKSWAKPQRICSPITILPSKSYIYNEPLGNTLIMAPWNYPVNLLLCPLIGAISAGCTAIVKPSPSVPKVSETLEAMLNETFEEDYIAVVQGEKEENQELFKYKFDLIFFTGSPRMGKVVMKAAAEHLTPVILELGGKSPCIVDKGVDLDLAARRIAWGKCLNAGQTCIAPDFLLIDKNLKNAFVQAYQKALEELYPEGTKNSPHFVKIVHDTAFERLTGYLQEGRAVLGGTYDRENRYIEPTLLDEIKDGAKVMEEEIFGPILPIVTYETREEMFNFVKNQEKPLALYYFGKEKMAEKVLIELSSGGVCINDTIMHIANDRLPFGGVGNSGMGQYHGKESFNVFSHKKSVVKSPTWIDMPFKYMPYKFFDLVKKLV